MYLDHVQFICVLPRNFEVESIGVLKEQRQLFSASCCHSGYEIIVLNLITMVIKMSM